MDQVTEKKKGDMTSMVCILLRYLFSLLLVFPLVIGFSAFFNLLQDDTLTNAVQVFNGKNWKKIGIYFYLLSSDDLLCFNLKVYVVIASW